MAKGKHKQFKKPEEVVLVAKVKMIFAENKFYRDDNVPIFEMGQVYELEGEDWIRRWQKRGGKIIDGKDLDSDKEVKTEETDLHEDSTAIH